MFGLQTAESATVPAAVPEPLPVLRLLYATAGLMQTLTWVFVHSWLTGSQWIGESIYSHPLRSARRNEWATTVPEICLSAFWLWVVTLLIVTIWQTGRLNNWGYNHWCVSEMHDLLVEKAQLQFDLHCVLSWKNKLAMQSVSWWLHSSYLTSVNTVCESVL